MCTPTPSQGLDAPSPYSRHRQVTGSGYPLSLSSCRSESGPVGSVAPLKKGRGRSILLKTSSRVDTPWQKQLPRGYNRYKRGWSLPWVAGEAQSLTHQGCLSVWPTNPPNTYN